MRIAFVMDDMSVHSNGTSVTAMRYAKAIRNLGHNVRIVGFGAHGADAFPVAEHFIPVVTAFSDREGFHFAKPDDSALAKAFDGVDIVHLFLPFQLERHALNWARAHRIPVSAAFHLMPESMTYGADLGAAPAVCDAIYTLWRAQLYDHVRHIHTISPLMKHMLKKHHYKSDIHVISNGVPSDFSPDDEAHFDDDLFHIATVGRLAPDKNQRTIIEAVGLARNRDRIKLHICGEGQLEEKLRHLGSGLPIQPSIEYLGTNELVTLERKCPLYVHASFVDSEAISVVEAFACGCVPVIGQAPMSAPTEFALTDRSLFPAHNAQALADRLDWWIEHPTELATWRNRYIAESEKFRIDECAKQFIEMEELAIKDDREHSNAVTS